MLYLNSPVPSDLIVDTKHSWRQLTWPRLDTQLAGGRRLSLYIVMNGYPPQSSRTSSSSSLQISDVYSMLQVTATFAILHGHASFMQIIIKWQDCVDGASNFVLFNWFTVKLKPIILWMSCKCRIVYE